MLPVLIFLHSYAGIAQQTNLFVKYLHNDFPEIENWISDIVQDKQGYIWFAGQSSFQKFDGNAVRTYPFFDLFEKNKKNMQGIGPVGLLSDRYGNLWAYAGGGLFLYHPDFDRFTWVGFDAPSDFFIITDKEQPEIFSINALMEDNQKNIWIGTNNGLLFYIPMDTIYNQLKVSAYPARKINVNTASIVAVNYRANLMENLIPQNKMDEDKDGEYFCPAILKILQDKDGDIWLNTNCRIIRIVRINGRWEDKGSFFINKAPRTHWTKNIFLDRERNLWIGAEKYLVRKYSPDSTRLSNWFPPILADRTEPYGPDNQKSHQDFQFVWYEFPHEMGFQGHTGWVDNVHVFHDNQIIIENEFSIMNYRLRWNHKNDPEFEKMYEFTKDDNSQTSWKYRPASILLTQEGILFVADFSFGVFTIDVNHHRMFHKLYNAKYDINSLPNHRISSMIDLGNNMLLFGGRENSVYKTDYSFHSFYKLPVQIDLIGNIDTWIIKMIADSNGHIWIQNFLGQVAIIRKSYLAELTAATACSQNIYHSNFGVPAGALFRVTDIAVDKSQIIWFASNQGLFYGETAKYGENVDWGQVRFHAFLPNPNSGDSELFMDIQSIVPVMEDFFLLVTEKEWIQFNPFSRKYWKIEKDHNEQKYLPRPRLETFQVSLSGQIWTSDYMNISKIIFTRGSSFPPYEASQTTYYTKDGFPTRALEFVTDKNNHLWIYSESGKAGIYRYDPRSNEMVNFSGPWIIEGAVFGGLKDKDLSGRIFFGAVDGITVFHPDSVRQNSFIPPVEITDIKVLHKSIYQSDDSCRLLALKTNNTLTLGPFENVLTIEFSSLSYSNPSRNRYAHFLEGFDIDTIITSASNRNATYSNLSPGTYQFYVNGSNNNNKWNSEWTRLGIVVLPPWYATTLAYIIYILIFFALVIGWRYYDLRRIRLQHKVKLEHAEAEKLRELDHIKSEFFANITHEFRTPLTLILGPLENISKGSFRGDILREAEIMKKNARRLMRLINQLLDFSRLDAGKMKLHAAEQDLAVFIRDVVANFVSNARSKKIELKCRLPQKPVMVYFDNEKMEDILENLIINALKFNRTEGKVIVSLNSDRPDEENNAQNKISNAVISIWDTGKGIPSEQLEKIFDRFYQVESSHTRKHEGAGIGLALVYELVKLHHGQISVKSKPGKGTLFTISLPFGKGHLSNEQIILSPAEIPRSEYKKISGELLEDRPATTLIGSRKIPQKDSILPVILLIEDNPDMRHYIIQNLDHQFIFVEAENGYLGYNKAVEIIPDMIITDLMMPGMDGYEFCRKVREDERIRHIPIIMLTAKAGKENTLSGYDCGVDDYVIKPFDQELLIARMNNLLRERKLLREKFSKQWAEAGHKKITGTADEKFLKKLNDILEKNYANPAFGIRLFTMEAGMSRSVLFRKLKAVTDLSPNAYIRNFRLIKAYHIISLGEADISTAAFQSGFNNLSYFSRCFKRLFNKSPNEIYSRHMI